MKTTALPVRAQARRPGDGFADGTSQACAAWSRELANCRLWAQATPWSWRAGRHGRRGLSLKPLTSRIVHVFPIPRELPRVRRAVDADVLRARLHAEAVEQPVVVVRVAVHAVRRDVELVGPLDQVEAFDAERAPRCSPLNSGTVEFLDVGVGAVAADAVRVEDADAEHDGLDRFRASEPSSPPSPRRPTGTPGVGAPSASSRSAPSAISTSRDPQRPSLALNMSRGQLAAVPGRRDACPRRLARPSRLALDRPDACLLRAPRASAAASVFSSLFATSVMYADTTRRGSPSPRDPSRRPATARRRRTARRGSASA